MSREAWLGRAVEALLPLVLSAPETLPETPAIRVSVGWPGGRSKKANMIGQAWHTDASSDGTAEIFISPVLDEPMQTLATLLHELCHVVDHNESGHRGRFKRLAVSVGLEGKMTATHAGERLTGTLTAIADSLGPFPHAKMNTGGGLSHPKQTTRMIKVECPVCAYTVRTTTKWLDIGYPTCPCGTEMFDA